MAVPEKAHDLQWLKESLQAAIELEFATIPPYLCAMWSIKNPIGPVMSSIRVVVREEMLHMGLVCNMLVAVGGVPKINKQANLPEYPGPLPGGVNPGLTVPLRGLSRDAVQLFMDIEYPENGPIALEGILDEYPTIGAFYTAVMNAFETLQPALSPDKQIDGPLGVRKLLTLQDVKDAIELIKRQGEGSDLSPDDTGPTDPAHYYRFGEIFHEKQLRQDPVTGKWTYSGNAIPFPDAWEMAETPPGGYQAADVPTDVAQLLKQFDEGFTKMTDQLQDAWENGKPASLFGSIPTMMSLRAPAVALMQKSISPGKGNYGPCFRLVAAP
jgi:hypothetical protein